MTPLPRLRLESQGFTKDQEEDRFLGSLIKVGIPKTALWPSGAKEEREDSCILIIGTRY